MSWNRITLRTRNTKSNDWEKSNIIISSGIQPLLISFYDSKVLVRTQRGIDISTMEERKSEIQTAFGLVAIEH